MLSSVIKDHENVVAKHKEKIKILDAKTATSAAKYAKGTDYCGGKKMSDFYNYIF